MKCLLRLSVLMPCPPKVLLKVSCTSAILEVFQNTMMVVYTSPMPSWLEMLLMDITLL